MNMSCMSGSRPTSADDKDEEVVEEDNNKKKDDDDDDEKFHSRKGNNNPDSGFHEENNKESYSSSSSSSSSSTVSGSTLGVVRPGVGRRRPGRTTESGGHSGTSHHPNSHDSIISESQIGQEQQQQKSDFPFNNNNSGSGGVDGGGHQHHNNNKSARSDKSGCSTTSSSGVIDTEVDSENPPHPDPPPHYQREQREQPRKNFKRRGKNFPPPPQTPPPTAFDGTNESTLDKTNRGDTVINYDFGSDTELSEIIAIMSGLATPKNPQRGPPPISTSFDTLPHHHLHQGQETTVGDKYFGDDPHYLHRYKSEDSVSKSTRQAESMPSMRRSEEDLEKGLDDRRTGGIRPTTTTNVNSGFHGVANGGVISGGGSNNKVRQGNAVAGRRYLQKQQWSKSVDVVSVSGSTGGGSLSELSNFRAGGNNKGGGGTPNSLNSILAASQKGTLGPNGKKKKKKPKIKAPPKKEEVMSEYSNRPSWKQRLKFLLTFIVSVTLILSGSSLLFVVPIVVDPILVGLEAQFSTLPAQCRTINKRNGTGAVECTIPSCREGCTADLVTCFFIEVEYQQGTFTTIKNGSKSSFPFPPDNNNNENNNVYIENNNNSTSFDPNDDSFNNYSSNSGSGSGGGVSGSDNDSPSFESMGFDQYFTPSPNGLVQNGTLLVNINGCGFPPETNCSEFEKRYSEVNTTFPCHWSQTNESIVVPTYSRHGEIIILSISLIIPLGTCLVCTILLYFLLRWKPKPKRNFVKKKVKEKDKDKEKETGGPPALANHVNNNKTRKKDVEEGNVKLRLSPTPQNHGSKSMGILSNIVGDLTGISAQNVMKKRNYAKFSTSFSNPDSQTNSRAGSTIVRGSGTDPGHHHHMDMELERIDSAHLVNRSMSMITRSRDDLGGSEMKKSITSTTFVDNYDLYENQDSLAKVQSSSSRIGNYGMSNGYVPAGTHYEYPKPIEDKRTRGGPKNNEISLDSPSNRRIQPSMYNNSKNLSTKTQRRPSVASLDSMDTDSVNTLSFGKL